MAFYSLFLSLPGRSVTELRNRLDKGDRRQQMRAIQNQLNGIAGGLDDAEVRTQVSTACASFTVTCDYDTLVLDTDNLSIGAVTLTAATTPATENDFAGGSTDATLATNLAAAINAHSVLSEFCTAAASSDVVTVTVNVPGVLGNQLLLADTGTSFTRSGNYPTGGDSDELDEWSFGDAL